MAFTGNEDHNINLEDAVRITLKYRDATGEDSFLGAYFGRAAIEEILAQEKCVGIRVYNAIHENGSPNYVIVGVTEDEADMFDGKLAEFGIGCPPRCPTNSPLTGTA